ncbi:MAG: ATP-dependent sacrificial sulfur transferase LarE [Planctomycetota bacterium]|nr:MAG: ATP-dependent sacrificial sulfur transferase LarE [Planctomycetota bacterium]
MPNDRNELEHTERLDRRQRELLELLHGFRRVIVALSGGGDSAVVAMAARLACGDDAWAVTAVSPGLAEQERRAAEAVARRIGIRHLWLNTGEHTRDGYRRNAPDRCFFCKDTLYATIAERVLPELPGATICNGANADDVGDWRPGMRAGALHGVRSPLLELGIGKAEVRALAREWELPIWDKPASPCLASRVAYGVEVTPDRLRRIERAEAFLREQFGLRDLRVRCEAGELARIEVPPADIPRLADPAAAARIAARLRELGFRCVTLDLEGLRSGNLNALIPLALPVTPGKTLPDGE